jgi:uncharacterized protein YbjQ (UPF0145 family)
MDEKGPIILTTTDDIDGRRIASYLGIVGGEAVMGTNLFRDLFADIRHIVGGRSASYETEMRRARTLAIEELLEEASELGADAVVGLNLDYESIGGGDRSMLMVSASGTAVRLG